MADKPATASPPPDAAALPAGYRIHEYEIDKPLGGGGFGITYLARDANLDLPVAIKEYFPSDLVTRGADQSVSVRAGNAEAQNSYDWGLERFLDEARALATFRHPNIVRALRYFKQNGTAYIVMEYESGLSLKRWVPQNAPLSQRAVLSIVKPLLDGLEQVHKAGFLHRDIKPDNIYVRADGTPVLLDFGAARRVNSNRDMTNIVSPGFAPFEQYHSQGNQGSWTDVYSIGAVMYWMVTGKKPMESASRVKTDSMLPASALAEASTYGLPLLRAIEWAMQPDETKRPQTVALFRDAIQGPEVIERSVDLDVTLDARGMAAAGHAISNTASASQMPSVPTQKRNLLGTILFMDLVGYSIRSVDDQAALKKLFNELTTKALRGVSEDSRIAIDTGDGAAICFMGDPEEALHSALLMRDLLGQRYGHVLSLRIGLHMGPLRIVSDINGRNNVVGDGINVAQRVMDFAQPNQVLVSRSYYDVVSRITDDAAGMFRYLGHHADKHGREHEVYAVDSAQGATQKADGPATGYTRTAPATALALRDDEVQEIEADLARHIGPLAKTLVAKARGKAASAAALREALAPSIQENRAREAFVAGGQSHPSSRSQPISGRHSGPPSVSVPLGRSGAPVSQPWPGSGPSGGSGTTRSAMASSTQVDLSAEEFAQVEATLSKFIGPMARMLIKKELGRARSLQAFISGVADNVDQAPQRADFLKALQKALPKRKL